MNSDRRSLWQHGWLAVALCVATLLSVRAEAANEIQFTDASLSGQTLYFVLFVGPGDAEAGEAWDGDSFETYTTTRDTWDIALTEVGSTGHFVGSIPAIGSIKPLRWQVQQDANDAAPPDHATDFLLAEGSGRWSGSKFITIADLQLAANTALSMTSVGAGNLATFFENGAAASTLNVGDLATMAALADLLHQTTVNTAPTTTTVILNTGPPDNNALLRHLAVFVDQSNPLQTSAVPVTNYVASTKTLTLHEAPAFTLAANDTVFFIPVGFSVADAEPYAGSDLEADIAGIDAGMGAAAANFANTEVVEARVIQMSARNDGTTVGTKAVRMRVGEKFKVWLDVEDVIGDGVWVDDAENPVSSSPSQLVVTATLGVNRELVVVELNAATAIAGATYTVTCDVEPRQGETIKAKFEVKISSD